MKIVALAGGVGGAKLVDGLSRHLRAGELTVIVNTGDDFNYSGLLVCPDLDTVCYMLAGISNPETGWGRAAETWHALESIQQLGGPAWFNLGDRDLGTHLERTRRILSGERLSEVVCSFCQSWGIKDVVLPMSDDPVPTIVCTEEYGNLPFQEYFVKHQCRPTVRGFIFSGVEEVRPAPGVLERIAQADLVILCPSNPWVSIDPILSIPGIRGALASKPVVAVSPLIGGQAVKGPAAKMYREMGIEPSAVAVADHYRGLLSGFVLDQVDEAQVNSISPWGIMTLVTNTWMLTPQDRKRLAGDILKHFCKAKFERKDMG